MAQPRRRLTVLQTSTEAQDEPRPAWQWAIFGAVVILVAWLPLAAIVGRGASALLTRWPQYGALAAVAQLLAYALASAAGGHVVVRYGEASTLRTAAASGVIVGLVGSTLAIGQGPSQLGPVAWILAYVLIVAVGAASAWAGGRMAPRRR